MSSVIISGDTSGTVTVTVPAVAGTNTVTIPAGTGTIAVQGVSTNIVSGTAVASTSGTSIDFTGIPSWVKRITVMFVGVSTNGGSEYLIRIGTSGGVETTGYAGVGVYIGTAGLATTSFTNGFDISNGNSAATTVFSGSAILNLQNASTNTWTCVGQYGQTDSNKGSLTMGSKSLSGTLDRVRITTVNGTDTFDAGSINILYE
jgi:hypothetical protein